MAPACRSLTTLPSGLLCALQAVTLTAKCGESNFAAVQLSVVKALLTFVTAEHFLVHGDSLMQVRAWWGCAMQGAFERLGVGRGS